MQNSQCTMEKWVWEGPAPSGPETKGRQWDGIGTCHVHGRDGARPSRAMQCAWWKLGGPGSVRAKREAWNGTANAGKWISNDEWRMAMKKCMKWALAAVAGLAWAGLAWAAETPQVIPFQGRLTNQQGTPYTEGTYDIVFSLYDAPVGGTALWTERHTGVGLVNGMVNVFLGSIVKLDGQDFTQVRYLGITIDADGNANTADPEMVPRQMVIPAFYAKDSAALRGADWSAILASGATDPRTGYIAGARIASKSVKAAQLADKNVTTAKLADRGVTGAKIATNSILPEHLANATLNDLASAFLPPGVIMPFAGPASKVPTGWLPCDGRAVASTTYPKLFANIGTTWGYETNITENGVTYFKLPDLRNRTLWGVGSQAVGKYIAAGLPNITGSILNDGSNDEGPLPGKAEANGAFAVTKTGANGASGNSPTGGYNFDFDASRSSSIYGKANTVQPPAGVVNFIIKVDPTY